MAIADLIARLENTSPEDYRSLENDIASELGLSMPAEPVGWPPNFCSSLDAAMTLVPEGWAWFVEWIGGEFSEGNGRAWIPARRTQGLPIENFEGRDCATPILALCIASLKARAAIAKAEGTER